MLPRRTWQTIASVFGALIVLYFVSHTIQGDRGWLAMLRLKGQVAQSQTDLSQLQKEHDELEHRIQLMRPGSLDPDLLDEKSRQMLDYSKPNEVIILTPPDPKQDLLQRSKNQP